MHDLQQVIREKEEALLTTKNDLQSAHNQMASDKEVKYYLDESFTRLTQELK